MNTSEKDLDQYMLTILHDPNVLSEWPHKFKQLAYEFAYVDSMRKKLDPDEELCWKSLTVGWALAKGLSCNKAQAFATKIRYHTKLG